MIGEIYQWLRANFFTKLELAGGVLDMRYYTKAAADLILAGYALLAGRAGGQTLRGGTAGGDDLTLMSTAHATKGRINMGDSYYEEAANLLRVVGSLEVSDVGEFTPAPGGIAAGRRDVDYTPTTANWSDEGCTILLTGKDYTVIGFHDSNTTVSFIRVGGGTITIGYDGGFGGAYVEMPGGLLIRRGAHPHGALTIGGTAFNSHFNYDTGEDTYIRGGKSNSRVVIGDASTGDVEVGGGGGALIVWNRLGTAWSGLSFGSGWTDYGAGFQTGQVKRVGDMIFLRGLVKRTSGAGASIATLPSGWRPPAQCLYSIHTNTGLGRLDIQADGQIILAAGGADWVQLEGTVFSTGA